MELETRVYAFNTISEDFQPKIIDSLQEGEARFGWSYCRSGNLLELQARIDETGLGSLSKEERDNYMQFLLKIRPGDYVVYINLPSYGKCTLARVTEPYFWEFEDSDFNHRLGVDPDSVEVFDRNDKIVHPALSRRLKLQGRWWQIYARDEFRDLLTALRTGGPSGEAADRYSRLQLLKDAIDGPLLDITKSIHHTHPEKQLEGLVELLLESAAGVAEVEPKKGRGDKGADLLVTMEREHPLTGEIEQDLCVVQVKSYSGTHDSKRAIEDLRRALAEYPEATEGLIISTGTETSEAFDLALEKFRQECGKPVRLVAGREVPAFLLRHGRSQLIS